MAELKPSPKMDYGAFVKQQLSQGSHLGIQWKKQVFTRVYNMMKQDPAFKDGDTLDYDAMVDAATHFVPDKDWTAGEMSGEAIFAMQQADPAYQKAQMESEQAADVAELNQQDISELQQLEQEQRPKPGAKSLTAKAMAALTQEQGNWVTLSSGKKILIKKK